jgi:hypothetical protein
LAVSLSSVWFVGNALRLRAAWWRSAVASERAPAKLDPDWYGGVFDGR